MISHAFVKKDTQQNHAQVRYKLHFVKKNIGAIVITFLLASALVLVSALVKLFVKVVISETNKEIHFKLGIHVLYLNATPLQYGRSTCILF